MEQLLPVIELLKKSFDAYLKKAWILIGTMLFSFSGFLAMLPSVVIGFLISYVPFKNSNFDLNIILCDVLLLLAGFFLAIILGLWSQTAMLCAVKEDSADFKKILLMAWPKIGSLFWVSFLAGLVIMGGSILFIIPGIIFSVWFCLSTFVFIAEDLHGTSALKRSKQLVEGYWWPVFGRLAVIGILCMLVSWVRVYGPIINIFFMVPFALVYEYMLYQDLKRVKG